jgi:hypothetical protein
MYVQKLKTPTSLKDNRLKMNYGVKFIHEIGYIEFFKSYILYDKLYYIGYINSNYDDIMVLKVAINFMEKGFVEKSEKWNKNEFIEKIEKTKFELWSSIERKQKNLETYNQILSDIISQERDNKLDFILVN